jgi:hypothetical protein
LPASSSAFSPSSQEKAEETYQVALTSMKNFNSFTHKAERECLGIF